ncbi:MAG: hypothetical protein HWN66_18725 [Candidatus Helarchaeota archaeon]|nr:hypothetical protein [Candidatus Helarchaeota archaeon]
MEEKTKIEKIEYEMLLKFNNVFNECIDDFNTKLDSSLNYLDFITLPVIMSSIEKKAYNPFSEIIEKYVEFIATQKMETHGYQFLPLGYSSDMCFNGEDVIIHIDIKTANLNNPSDFKNTIPIGFNQTSYHAKLPLGVRGSSFYVSDGKEPFKVYPVLPAEYEINGKKKTTITNALLFIYPDYKDIMDEFRTDYEEILSLIGEKLKIVMLKILKGSFKYLKPEDVEKFLEKKNKNTNIENRRVLYENIVRGYYIHDLADKINSSFDLSDKEKKKMGQFIDKLKKAAQKLREREIKPVAIISISIPNGKLSPHYDNEIVSGKSYGKSIRYHYEDGKFKLLSTNKDVKSRVVFLDYNKKYLGALRKYFTKICVFETKQKEITRNCRTTL